jgi:hypothetical protein
VATIKIALLPDNTVMIAVTEGADFPEAKRKIEALVASLGVEGFSVKLDGAVEQHRHDEKKVEVAGRQTAR